MKEKKAEQHSCVTDLADRADDGKSSPLPCDPMKKKKEMKDKKEKGDMKKEIARFAV